MAYSKVVCLVLIIASTFLTSAQETASSPPFKNASSDQKYAFYCAGCHGDKLEKFNQTNWRYGKDNRSVAETIKNGRSDVGMPAFSASFSDNEIEALSAYIIKNIGLYHNEKNTSLSKTFVSNAMNIRIDTVATGLDAPWGLAFLPDKSMLVTEKKGTLLRITTSGKRETISGLPPVYVRGQGGLMDVRLHPNYTTNGWIYFSYAAPAADRNNGGNTAIFRARLVNKTLTDIEYLFKGEPNSKRGQHYGSRIVFKDGYIYFSIGERGVPANAQNLSNHCGKIHRLYDNGRTPEDNPFVNVPHAMPSIWSYGHRNPQGLAIHPISGQLWAHEHGPRGGDELNLIQGGKNFGWPEITFGINYNGTIITQDTAKTGMELPVHYWIPSIAPCGMTFSNSNKYPQWGNSVFIGSLRFKHIERCEIKDNKVVKREILLNGIGRVRNVITGTDGLIYVAVENPGFIIRLTPTTPITK